MNKDLAALKDTLNSLIESYQKVLKLLDKERECLIKVHSNGLIEILRQKQTIAEKISAAEKKLKTLLDKYSLENINEFLFFASKNNYVDDVRVLNGKLKTLLQQFALKSEVNRMIAQEHLEFFSGLLAIYANLFSSVNYDKNASTNIGTQIMNVRV